MIQIPVVIGPRQKNQENFFTKLSEDSVHQKLHNLYLYTKLNEKTRYSKLRITLFMKYFQNNPSIILCVAPAFSCTYLREVSDASVYRVLLFMNRSMIISNSL